MAFEKLKEQLKEQWGDLKAKANENSAFNNVREKFEAQSPTIQKAIIGGICLFVAIMLLSFPWGFLSDSFDHMTQFEENRGLIQGLLHASRAAKEPSPLPPPVPFEALKSRVEQVLKQTRLIPDQIGEMQPLPDRPARDLAPSVVIQTGIVVQLKKLNLDQIVTLSHEFQNLGIGTKLMGIDISQTPGQSHYYEMNARIVNFALPALGSMDIEEPKKGGKGSANKRGSARKAAPKDDEEAPE